MVERILQWFSTTDCTVTRQGREEIFSMMENIVFVKVASSTENEHRTEDCVISIKLPLSFWPALPPKVSASQFAPYSPFVTKPAAAPLRIEPSIEGNSTKESSPPSVETKTAKRKRQQSRKRSYQSATPKRPKRAQKKKQQQSYNNEDDEGEHEEKDEMKLEDLVPLKGEALASITTALDASVELPFTTVTTTSMPTTLSIPPIMAKGGAYQEIKVHWYWSGESDGGRDYAFLFANKPVSSFVKPFAVSSAPPKDIVLVVLGEEVSDWDKSLVERPNWLLKKLRFTSVTRSQLLFALLCGLAEPYHYGLACQSDESLEVGIENCLYAPEGEAAGSKAHLSHSLSKSKSDQRPRDFLPGQEATEGSKMNAIVIT